MFENLNLKNSARLFGARQRIDQKRGAVVIRLPFNVLLLIVAARSSTFWRINLRIVEVLLRVVYITSNNYTGLNVRIMTVYQKGSEKVENYREFHFLTSGQMGGLARYV